MRMFYTSSSKYEDDDDVDKRIWSIESKKNGHFLEHTFNEQKNGTRSKKIHNECYGTNRVTMSEI